MGFVNEKTENGDWQTIDKEKKIILVRSRSLGPEDGYEFELTIDNQPVRFLCFSRTKIRGDPVIGELNKYDVNWKIYRMQVPEALQGRKQEIMSLIREALAAHGYNYRAQQTSSVSIQFSPNLI